MKLLRHLLTAPALAVSLLACGEGTFDIGTASAGASPEKGRSCDDQGRRRALSRNYDPLTDPCRGYYADASEEFSLADAGVGD